MKAQAVRVLDVFVIGPLMLWGAATSTGAPLARFVLGLAGLLTISYNGRNYLDAGP